MSGTRLTTTLAFVFAALLVGCGGGGGSSGGEANDDLSDLVLIDVNVGGTDGVGLNQILSFEFSEQVVGTTVTPETSPTTSIRRTTPGKRARVSKAVAGGAPAMMAAATAIAAFWRL